MQVCKNLTAIQERIDQLESAGWHIRLIHDIDHTRSTIMLAERGQHNVTKKIFAGQARCVKQDQFCRSTGTRIAFNRMIHHMSAALGRDTVKQIFA